MSICGILDIRSYNIITAILIIWTNNLIKTPPFKNILVSQMGNFHNLYGPGKSKIYW